MPRVQTNVRLTTDARETLERLANERRQSQADVMIDLLRRERPHAHPDDGNRQN